jgi:hypothetical protein
MLAPRDLGGDRASPTTTEYGAKIFAKPPSQSCTHGRASFEGFEIESPERGEHNLSSGALVLEAHFKSPSGAAELSFIDREHALQIGFRDLRSRSLGWSGRWLRRLLHGKREFARGLLTKIPGGWPSGDGIERPKQAK